MSRFVLSAAASLALLGASALGAQSTREVSGRVVEAGSNAPLADVTVGVVGQLVGVRTNDRGEYRLRVPAGDVVLTTRAIGYKRTTQRVPAIQATADFTLSKDILQLEGVTVTGAATSVDRRNATTAVSQVNAEQITRSTAPSLEGALQGKVVGATFNYNNGAPGGGAQVQIRGASSLIGRIDPLFVVDGVIISNTVRSNRQSVITSSLNAGEENTTNRLADLNPAEIENIEILKGAAASAIYGSQATNGVVVITTKRGRSGAPRFNLTQRIGAYQTYNLKGMRQGITATEALANPYAGGAEAVAYINSVCTPNCPYYDLIGEFYNRVSPSYETVGSLSGGVENTKYFVSASNRYEAGTAINTGARRQGLRANIDQSIGGRVTTSVGVNVLRSFSQRGISNNDNTNSSPMYAFFTSLPIIDLKQRNATGNFAGMYIDNPFCGGVRTCSNPWQTFDMLQNNEDVNRYIVSGRVNFNAFTSAAQNLQFSYVGGLDKVSTENYGLAPPRLQFQRPGTNKGTFPGTAIQGNGSERLNNHAGNLVHSLTGWSQYFTATTSAGLQYEERFNVDYNLIGRGLIPGQVNASGATNIDVTNFRTLVRNQAFYAQEEILTLNERLLLNAAVRGERSSVNGDQKKLYYFPRVAASYRVPSDFIPGGYISELKLRGATGSSGNQPNYGEKFVTLTNAGQIGGSTALIQAATLGNPNIKPERLRENEFGLDASLFRERVRFEGTYYDRKVTDLLLRPTLAPSSGVFQQVINGGVMTSRGMELGLTVIPVQQRFGARDFSWTSRVTYFSNENAIKSFPTGVKPFLTGTAAGGFGPAFGRLRYTTGYPLTTIWGNKTFICPTGVTVGVCSTRGGQLVTVDTALGDANPDYMMGFSNDFSWGNLTLSSVFDLRKGGLVSNMSTFSFDDGQNTWDYDKPVPAGVRCPTSTDLNAACTSKTLGEWRVENWRSGANTPALLEDGSFVKLRELTLSYDVPASMLVNVPGLSARTMRMNVSGRNLVMWTKYNGFDPEMNNGGALLPARFVDLAQWPPTRNFFFSVDIGF